MHKIVALLLTVGFIFQANAQHNFNSIIKDSESGLPLAGVTIYYKAGNISSISDSTGFAALVNIRQGIQVIVFNLSGYKTVTRKFSDLLRDKQI